MKKQIFVILFCLACGLFSCTQTDSSTTTKELTPDEIAEEIHTISRSGLRGNSEKLMKYVNMIDSNNVVQVVNIFLVPMIANLYLVQLCATGLYQVIQGQKLLNT